MSEREVQFEIQPPADDDAMAVGSMQVQAWHEAYLHPQLGVTDDVIQAAIEFVATPAGEEYRKGIFAETRATPDRALYRVVKDPEGRVVGFMHATKDESANELDGIYLLDTIKGQGVGDKLMEAFLSWHDPAKPTTLQVIAFNDRALSFYEKYGFERTEKELEPFKEKFPIAEMIKPAAQ